MTKLPIHRYESLPFMSPEKGIPEEKHVNHGYSKLFKGEKTRDIREKLEKYGKQLGGLKDYRPTTLHSSGCIRKVDCDKGVEVLKFIDGEAKKAADAIDKELLNPAKENDLIKLRKNANAIAIIQKDVQEKLTYLKQKKADLAE